MLFKGDKGMQNIVLIGYVITHYVLVGADAFAQAAITPVVLSAPPASLAMFQGEYVYESAPFWQIANMLGLALLIAALAMHWHTVRRNPLVMTLAGFLLVSVVSLAYIFPEFTAIVSSSYSDTVDPALIERGAAWRAVAFSRLLSFGCLGLLPLWALTRPLS